MATRIHEAFGLNKDILKAKGIFNGFIDVDSKLYIDPYLLIDCDVPEFKNSYQTFEAHFEEVFKLLSNSKNTEDLLFRTAVKKLIFAEKESIGLGYASNNQDGSGIGPKLAKNLAETAFEIINVGIKDPTFFELLGLIESGVGADRISDMTASIIYSDILLYNDRLINELSVKNSTIDFDKKSYRVPYSKEFGKYLFLPENILRNLPVAIDWNSIDIVASENEKLRKEVNKIIGRTWKTAQNKVPKKDLKRVLLDNPELIEDLIDTYKSKNASSYDFVNDPEGKLIWYEIAKEFSSKHPFKVGATIKSSDDVYVVVKNICDKFVYLIENNGLNKLLYYKGKRRNEDYAQLLFYGIAESYCESNNIDISAEPNTGRGPVDFKFSAGFNAKVLVEVKFSSNTGLYRGYTTQLEIYNKQEKTNHSIYLILEDAKDVKQLKDIYEYNNQQPSGKRIPEIITADIEIKPSASKAKKVN